MTDDDIKRIVQAEAHQSIGYYGGKLADQRQKALYYYEGLPKGDLAPPEVEGRSQVVVTEVRNVIESMLPELMAKFGASENIVEAEAKTPKGEPQQKLITQYLNCIFYKKNQGHRILETWFKDALLSKAGIVKYCWDRSYETTREEYKGLTDIELAQLLDDPAIEGLAQVSYPDPDGMEPRLTDISIKRTDKRGKISIMNVPPEEFMISRTAKDIKNASFVGHRVVRTYSELKSSGYKNVDSIHWAPDDMQFSAESIERNTFDDDMYPNTAPENGDKSQRRVTVIEAYIRADRDDDGITELLKVVMAGDTILEIETVDEAPFAHIVPIILPHRFFGLSIADLAMEPQRVKTALMRAVLDNAYLQVNGRYFAVDSQVNIDDLMDSRPGGIVRVKSPGVVGRLDQGVGDAGIGISLLNYLQEYTEESTGWHRAANAQSNPDSINRTATEANIMVNRAQMRTDLVARNFADGLITLFEGIFKLICQHQDYVEDVKYYGEWLKVDPTTWRDGYEFTLNVGLGTGSKDQQVNHLMMLMQAQREALQIGVATPDNILASARKLAEALGFRNPDQFWSNPGQAQQAQEKVDPAIQKLQLEAQKAQMDMQMRQAELAQESAMRERELQLEAQKQALQAQHDMAERQHKAELDAQLAEQRLEFERWRAELESRTQIAVAQMRLQNNGNYTPQPGADAVKMDAENIAETKQEGGVEE